VPANQQKKVEVGRQMLLSMFFLTRRPDQLQSNHQLPRKDRGVQMEEQHLQTGSQGKQAQPTKTGLLVL
jgi:hypothetical protein